MGYTSATGEAVPVAASPVFLFTAGAICYHVANISCLKSQFSTSDTSQVLRFAPVVVTKGTLLLPAFFIGENPRAAGAPEVAYVRLTAFVFAVDTTPTDYAHGPD